MAHPLLSKPGDAGRFYLNQAAVNADTPYIGVIQKLYDNGNTCTLRTVGEISSEDFSFGPPVSAGAAPVNATPVPIGSTPGPYAMVPLAKDLALLAMLSAGSTAYGQVSFASGSPVNISLAANAFQSLTGGTLQPAQREVTYNAATGEMTINQAGDYVVSGTLIAERALGLSTQLTAAVFVNAVQSTLTILDSVLTVLDRETNSASQILRLAAGDKLAMRVRSGLAITLGVLGFSFSAHRIGA